MSDAKVLVTLVALALIVFLVVAGTLAKDINYTAIALAILSLLGLMWGDPLNRRKDDR